MFKQLLQAKAIDFCQIDSARLGGLNEVMIVLLMAAKFGVPVCPHAGGNAIARLLRGHITPIADHDRIEKTKRKHSRTRLEPNPVLERVQLLVDRQAELVGRAYFRGETEGV
jgi:L-alanine-DL-glutamate epimerase-like enolase superfamily enzyme